MRARILAGIAALTLGTVSATTFAFAQRREAITHGPATGGSPAWFLMNESDYVPGGVHAFGRYSAARQSKTITGCEADAGNYCSDKAGGAERECLAQNTAKLSEICKSALVAMATASAAANAGVPSCNRAPVCNPRIDGDRKDLQSVEWKQTLGYSFAYPITLPEGEYSGASAAAVDSMNDVWVLQRNDSGKPQLFEFGPDHKLIRSVGDDTIGHQYKAHGMAIDKQDNVWICDANGSTVKKLSPEGKLILTIGVRGHRGDWDEAKRQRFLWQPLMVAFGPNGDIYIGEGHANESPNDAESDDPTDDIGAARVIHLNKDGKFINQWYGNSVGQGLFSMVHGLAVDRRNGDVYVGDREQYRIVVYTGDGKFLRTMQMRNLTCALYFDKNDQLWVATGWDGQIAKVDKQTGKVLGAIGNGNGIGTGQFLESDYFAMDSHGDIYAGDTARGRVTEMIPTAR